MATPNTYTVQSGDTLSKIASNYGTTIGNITGYRSGNPNLIYPGEVLTIGGQPAPATNAPPTTPPPTIQTSSAPRTQTNSNMQFTNNFLTPTSGGVSSLPFSSSTPQNNTSTAKFSQPIQPPTTTPTATSQPVGTAQPTTQTSPTTPTTPSTPTQSTAPQINNTNPAFQNIVAQMNQILQNPQVQQVLTPEMQAQISKINGLDSTIQTASANAQQAYAQGDYVAGNSYTDQLKAALDEQSKLNTDAHASLQKLNDAITVASQKPQSELDLENQYADIQTQIKQYDLALQKTQQSELDRGGLASTNAGFANRDAKNAELGRQGLQLTEQNTLLKLKLAQADRQFKVDVATRGYTRAIDEYKLNTDAIKEKITSIEAQQKANIDTVNSITSLADEKLAEFEKNKDSAGGIQYIQDLSKKYNIDSNFLLSTIDALRVKNQKAGITQPTSVLEYEYAKSQGYKGSFTQYQNEDANRKARSITATQPIVGLFTKAQSARLETGGVSLDLGTKIAKAILSGATLDEIRNALRKDGIDPIALDRFDNTVGIQTLLQTGKAPVGSGFQ